MRYTYITFGSLVALILYAVGCATQNPVLQPSAGFAAVSCPTNKAIVYLYRVRVWHPDGDGIKMYVNDIHIASLHGHEYCALVLDPGFVTLSHGIKYGPYGL